jgi:hypothetical protein
MTMPGLAYRSGCGLCFHDLRQSIVLCTFQARTDTGLLFDSRTRRQPPKGERVEVGRQIAAKAWTVGVTSAVDAAEQTN